MKSFFKELEVPVVEKAQNQSKKVFKCGVDCKLNNKQLIKGSGKKQILIISDRFHSEQKHYKKVKEVLAEVNINIDIDCWFAASVLCYTPKDRLPKFTELQSCKLNLLNFIQDKDPKVIILLGENALDSIIGDKYKGRIRNQKNRMIDWNGEIIPDQQLKRFICPLYHPSHLEKFFYDKVLARNWKKELKRAVKHWNKPFYISNYHSDVFITLDVNEAISWIQKARKEWTALAFDYETNSLKPYRKESKIYTASISNGISAYAFPFFENEEFKKEWKRLLRSQRIIKIAQNMKFERMWTQNKLGYDIRGPEKDPFYCTMIGQHCLDNRKIVGLKFWTYIRFGVLGYDDSVHSFFNRKKPGEDPKSSNSLNCIDEAPIEEVLQYNGEDSLYTFKLWELQNSKLDKHMKKGVDLFLEGSTYLLKAQNNGVQLDVDLMEQELKIIEHKQKRLKKIILESEEVKKWKGGKSFNFASGPQLGKLLFDILKIPVVERTASGQPSTDVNSLEKLNIPFVNKILKWRKLEKAKGTYIGQFQREHIKGVLHPFFSLGNSGSGKGVSTFRSCSGNPNLQNQPKRDKKTAKIIRSLIKPRKGNRLIEYDFKSMEVSGSACYNKDPKLIEYLIDPTTDMHRDDASDLFIKPKSEIDKVERFVAKNNHVFASFYGSYYEQTAPDLWENMPDYTKEHLRKKGIKTFDQFVRHVQKVDEILWKRFEVYAKWKKDTYKKYERLGYIDYYTGFRVWGSMKRNEAVNYPIQGSSFHCLLWTFIQVAKEMEKRNFKSSFLIGQIHDSILADVHPEEETTLDKLVNYYGTIAIREYWKWIIVPLKIEKERSEINGSWAEMSDCGYLKEVI